MLSSLAVWTGLEPATPCVTGRYSNQLNYHTVLADLRCKDSISFPSLQISPIFTSRLHEETIAQGHLFTACISSFKLLSLKTPILRQEGTSNEEVGLRNGSVYRYMVCG